MGNERIDVLMPTFNGEKYISEQITSIINQSHTNFRLIIRDDASKDNTKQILLGFSAIDSRISIINDNEGNIGLLRNIEKLMNASDADYIMFSDQDDIWLKEKIDVLYTEMKRMESFYDKHIPKLVHSDCFVTDSKLNKIRLFKGKQPLKHGLENSLFKFQVQGSSTIINKSLKEIALPICNNVYIHDRYLHILCELFGIRKYIEMPLMYYRQHGNNAVGSKSIMQKIKSNLICLPRHFFLNEDKLLIESIIESRNIKSDILEAYLLATNEDISKLKRKKIIDKRNFDLSFKQKILFWIR